MTSPVPLELQSKIDSWRLRAAEGTLTEPEMLEAITFLRAGRLAAGTAAKKAAATKKKAFKEIPSADDLLSELDGL